VPNLGCDICSRLLTRRKRSYPVAETPLHNCTHSPATGNFLADWFSAPDWTVLTPRQSTRLEVRTLLGAPLGTHLRTSVLSATSCGRSGFGPQLSLSYDSDSGNGPFGFGWSLSLPSIARKTGRGLPSDVFILSGSEDSSTPTPCASCRRRCRFSGCEAICLARGTSGLPAASVTSDFKKQKSPTWWALRLHKPEDSIMFQHLALVARET
jgi:hypothetical protein